MVYEKVNLRDSKYRNWLASHVGGCSEHTQLFDYLLNTPFVWKIELDENRAIDGMKLRDIYESKHGVLTDRIRDSKCSILEMLVALAIRIETDIMGDGDRKNDDPSKWFWIMLENLEIDDQDDDRFDQIYVDEHINIWLDREFDDYGNGSIFPVNDATKSQKSVQIWDQMSQFLYENYTIDC